MVFNSTLTFLELRFETTRSGLPSLLKSADATVKGFEPTAKVTGDLKAPSPLPSITEIVLELNCGSCKSRNPSPLRSVAIIDAPTLGAEKACAALKVALPLPNSTLTTSDSVPAMSAKPSRLKSATVSSPVMPMIELEVKLPVPVPRKRVLLGTFPGAV